MTRGRNAAASAACVIIVDFTIYINNCISLNIEGSIEDAVMMNIAVSANQQCAELELYWSFIVFNARYFTVNCNCIAVCTIIIFVNKTPSGIFVRFDASCIGIAEEGAGGHFKNCFINEDQYALCTIGNFPV